MKYRIPNSIALLLLNCLLLPATVFSANVFSYQEEIPASFTLPDLSDEQHSMSDYRNKVVLVNFWASWCPPCIYELPELTHLKEQMSDQPFEILAINVGEKKYKVRKFTKLVNFELSVLLDTSKTLFDEWQIKTLPTSYLIDADGNIRYRIRGNPGWDTPETLTLIQQLITEQRTTEHSPKQPIND